MIPVNKLHTCYEHNDETLMGTTIVTINGYNNGILTPSVGITAW